MKKKILVDVRNAVAINGGIHQAALGLSRVLDSLNDFQFLWLVSKENENDFAKVVNQSQEIICLDQAQSIYDDRRVRYLLDRIRNTDVGDFSMSLLRKRGALRFQVMDEPEIVNRINPDIIHFTSQLGFRTKRKNVYQPHDIQHVFFPYFFSREELVIRKVLYPFMMNQASSILVGNSWTRKTIVENFTLMGNKIEVVPVFSENLKSIESPSAEDKLITSLPRSIIYPAAGWAHKNHLVLFLAFRELLDKGYDITLTLTGLRPKDYKSFSEDYVDLIESKRLKIYGKLEKEHFESALRNSNLMVIPSLFEAESLPIWEAFNLGIPVVASDIPSIRDQVADAALLFDPRDSGSLSSKLIQILEDEDTRTAHISLGKQRVERLTEENSRLGMRYVYRRVLDYNRDPLDFMWEKDGFLF